MCKKGYYYCSLDTFLNIVKNKELYLSDPLKMNDTSEILWYLERLKEHRDKFEYELDEIALAADLSFEYDEYIHRIKEKGQRNLFLVCFSEKPDLLSQWRAYGKDGKGVAIGFDLNLLNKENEFGVEKVNYVDELKEIDNELTRVLRNACNYISMVRIDNKDEKIDFLIKNIISALAKYKNPAFREESEVRLIYNEDKTVPWPHTMIGTLSLSFPVL